jgi:hypothetical protein
MSAPVVDIIFGYIGVYSWMLFFMLPRSGENPAAKKMPRQEIANPQDDATWQILAVYVWICLDVLGYIWYFTICLIY